MNRSLRCRTGRLIAERLWGQKRVWRQARDEEEVEEGAKG